MYNIAVDALSDPATTAPVERVFSRASYILSKKDITCRMKTYKGTVTSARRVSGWNLFGHASGMIWSAFAKFYVLPYAQFWLAGFKTGHFSGLL